MTNVTWLCRIAWLPDVCCISTAWYSAGNLSCEKLHDPVRLMWAAVLLALVDASENIIIDTWDDMFSFPSTLRHNDAFYPLWLPVIKILRWRQSIVKTVDSYLRIYCYFYTGQVGHNTRVDIWHLIKMIYNLTILTMNLSFFYIKFLISKTHVPILCILSRRKNSITIDS